MEKQITHHFIANSKELFTPDPDNPEMVVLTIPPEVLKQADIQPGEEVKIKLGDKGTIIIEKITK